MIVVDVNVVAYFLIDGEKTASARNLLRRDPDWRLPPLWRHEFLHVLATFAREGGATTAEAQRLWQQGIELFGPGEESVDMEAALALAIANRISAYDAQYIALARQLRTVCVSEDRRLLGTFPTLSRAMQAFEVA
ncbi:MAG: type II toxin-antitoxin system VapC family toxin [Pseudomonadota bacterium]